MRRLARLAFMARANALDPEGDGVGGGGVIENGLGERLFVLFAKSEHEAFL